MVGVVLPISYKSNFVLIPRLRCPKREYYFRPYMRLIGAIIREYIPISWDREPPNFVRIGFDKESVRAEGGMAIPNTKHLNFVAIRATHR
jgi:hypothetical protein